MDLNNEIKIRRDRYIAIDIEIMIVWNIWYIFAICVNLEVVKVGCRTMRKHKRRNYFMLEQDQSTNFYFKIN